MNDDDPKKWWPIHFKVKYLRNLILVNYTHNIESCEECHNLQAAGNTIRKLTLDPSESSIFESRERA